MIWSYGITTTVQRTNGILWDTIRSLAAAGFDQPVLFVDGVHPDSLPTSLRVVRRNFQHGNYGNWLLSAWDLYLANPHADRYAIFEDDLIACKNLRQYLEECPWPLPGYANLYSIPENEGLAPEVNGWHHSNQLGRGAVGLAFDNQGLRALLSTGGLVEHPLHPARGKSYVDGAVVEAMRQHHYREYVHKPGLLQHTGKVSVLNHPVWPLSQTFPGEGFDAMTLISDQKKDRINMLAPIDKVRSRVNDICQVVITRKCDIHTCSNCTQLLPFRQDAKEMSLECFAKAVTSLRGWPGVIACFGGNPVMHSQFPEICRILCELVPNQAQRGLWTNNLMGHGELIQKTFYPHGRFNLNVHGNLEAEAEMHKWLPGIKTFGATGRDHHGAMLLDRKDYGYSDEEWVAMREKCDINRNWSAGIYERDGEPYVYFCEVAGSLDGVRGENNGLPAAPGWWSWPIENFRDQIKQCCDRGCGVPLRGHGHQDRQDVYDISPSWQSTCETQRKGKVSIEVKTERPAALHELTDYIGLREPATAQ